MGRQRRPSKADIARVNQEVAAKEAARLEAERVVAEEAAAIEEAARKEAEEAARKKAEEAAALERLLAQLPPDSPSFIKQAAVR